MRNTFPLLDLGWRRRDCIAYLTAHGLADTPRSACVGCPYHTDAEWARLRADDPAGWTDAVAFDAAIRTGRHGPTSTGIRCAGGSSYTPSGSRSARSGCAQARPARTPMRRAAGRGLARTPT